MEDQDGKRECALDDPQRRVSEPVIGWLLLGVAALTVISAVLPWATVLGISIKGTVGDGKLSIFCGAVLAVLGVLIGVRQGRLWVSIVAILRRPVQNP